METGESKIPQNDDVIHVAEMILCIRFESYKHLEILYIYSGLREQVRDPNLFQLLSLLFKNNNLLFFGVSAALCLTNSWYNELLGGPQSNWKHNLYNVSWENEKRGTWARGRFQLHQSSVSELLLASTNFTDDVYVKWRILKLKRSVSY